MTYLWADFLIILLCFVFIAFILNVTNILNLLLIGELFWIIIFFFGLSLSLKYDSLLAFLLVIYTLVLATIETSIGLSLLIFKKYSSGSLLNFLVQDNANYNIKKKKNFFFKKKVNLNLKMPEMLVDFFIERNSYYLPMILATLAVCFYRARWFLVARFIDLHYMIEATDEMWYEIEQVFIHEPLDEYEILLIDYYSRRFARSIFRATFLQATITKLLFYLKPISLKIPKIGYLSVYSEHNKKFKAWFNKNI